MRFVLWICCLSLSANASFENTSHRYLMPGDYFNKILTLFPNAHYDLIKYYNSSGDLISYHSGVDCFDIRSSSKPIPFDVLGASSAATGEPLSATPDMSLVNGLIDCTQQVVEKELYLITESVEKKYDPFVDLNDHAELAQDSVRRIFKVFTLAEYKTKLWLELDTEDRQSRNHTIYLVNWILGPDELIKDYGHALNAESIADSFLKQAKGKKMNLRDYTKWVIMNLVIRDEFLSF